MANATQNIRWPIRLFIESQENKWKFLETVTPDQAINGGFFIRSPWPVVSLTLMYIVVVCIIGPAYMKNRQAYKLKMAIRLYNLIEVFMAGYLYYRMQSSVGKLSNLFDCKRIFTFDDGSSDEIFALSSIVLFIRCTEYLDTIFFTLRKKDNQITFLHVYHHAFVPMYGYWILRTAPTRFNVYILAINSLIHIIMYFYYFLATFQEPRGSEKSPIRRGKPTFLMFMIQKILLFKKYVTQLQIFQFVSLTFYTLWAIFQPKCQIPRTYIISNLYVALSFLGLFLHFYLQSYKKSTKAKHQ